jgi:ADP-ribose pyrophosphatase YjhB (NUDIX family)
MIDEYQKKYRIPSLTTDAIVLRKHKSDPFHDILLVTRGHYPEEGKLAFPGGFVEYGENPENGCLRELKEETELDGKDIELLTVRGNPKRDPRRHTVSIFYLVKVDPDDQPKGADDAKDAKFYDLKDIIENQKERIAFDHYGVIEELVQKKFKDLYELKEENLKLKGTKLPTVNLEHKKKYILEEIRKLKFEVPFELKDKNSLTDLIKQKEKIEKLEKKTEQIYDEKLENIKKMIDELISKKWEIFDEKVKKLREIKSKKEEIDKKLYEAERILKESSDKLKTGNNRVIYSLNNKEENNYQFEVNNKVNVFTKVREILDDTVDKVKGIVKENINKGEDELRKKEEIDKIKRITNESIDEINKLTKFVVEQSNALIEKINGKKMNLSEKIEFKEINKEDINDIKCENCGIKMNKGDRLKSNNSKMNNNEEKWIWGIYTGK